jgi:DNA repair exonuclease SbcCD nuclease subunit
VRYLLVGDIHFADRPPSSCTDSYLDDLFDLMAQTVEISHAHGIEVIWAGDVFHVKAAARNSHRLVQRVMELCKAYDQPPWIVTGNHDIEHDRLESLDKQPLGTLFRSGVARPCTEGMAPPLVHGVPWQQDWSQFNPPALDANELIVAHAPLYPVPPPHDEYYSPEVWSQLQISGSCYYGHIHELAGSYKVGDVWFCNQGAITRGSLHEYDLRRRVAVTIWDSEKAHNRAESPFQRVELNQKPAEQVFRLADKAKMVDQSVRLDEFLEAVGTTQLGQVTVEAVLQHAAETLTPDQLALVRELLDAAS